MNMKGGDIGLVGHMKSCTVGVGLGLGFSGFSAVSWTVLHVPVGSVGSGDGSVTAVVSPRCRSRLLGLLFYASGLSRVPAFNHSPYGFSFLSSSLADLHSFNSWPILLHVKH